MGEVMKNFIETVTSRSDMITEAFLQHIFLSFVALAIGILIALPTGMLVARHRRFAEPIIGVAAILQTIPSLALFGFLVPLIGIGSKTALIALIIYALLPIVRNTYAGLTGVDEAIVEAGRGMGMTPNQILKKIEFPIALPVIMAGIRTATVLTVALLRLQRSSGQADWEMLFTGGYNPITMRLFLQGRCQLHYSPSLLTLY